MEIPSNKKITKEHKKLLMFLKREGMIYPWRKLIIGIDGYDGVGKSSLAAFLSWQLGMPYIPLDEFHETDVEGRSFPILREVDLRNYIESRLSTNRPIIVEGILLLKCLDLLGYKPDIYIITRLLDDDSVEIGVSYSPGGFLEKLYNDYFRHYKEVKPDYVFENHKGEMS